jgi:hypothetical protein
MIIPPEIGTLSLPDSYRFYHDNLKWQINPMVNIMLANIKELSPEEAFCFTPDLCSDSIPGKG